jgi:ribonuclease P protein subunit RPR2
MKKASDKKIAKERIIYLFKQAEKALKSGKRALAKRYVSLALKIGMKFQMSMPKELKRRYCKICRIYWVPSKTVRIRSKKKEKRVIFTCLECGTVRRYPYVKEKL